MTKLEQNQMSNTIGGNDVVDGICLGLAGGAAYYGVGVILNWWNPVGWINAAVLVAAVGCFAIEAAS